MSKWTQRVLKILLVYKCVSCFQNRKFVQFEWFIFQPILVEIWVLSLIAFSQPPKCVRIQPTGFAIFIFKDKTYLNKIILDPKNGFDNVEMTNSE